MTGARQKGFTLLEMVVALLLLSILSVMTFQGVQGLWQLDEESRTGGSQEAALSRVWQVFGADLTALRPRLFADGRGGWQRAFETGISEFVVQFSRAGEVRNFTNPSGLVRVRYRLEQDQLWRESWPATSVATDEPSLRLLLTGVDTLTVETLAEDNRYTPNWPPLNEQVDQLSLPRMIRVELTLQNGDTTRKLFPGVVDAFVDGSTSSGGGRD